MKRFYREARAVAVENGYGIILDGKPVRTPEKTPLAVPSRALAEAIAAEWQVQGDDIKLESLPLTRLASAAIDLVVPRRGTIVAEITKYAATELLCYRVAAPPALAARQARLWQPLLDWARERYGAPLLTTTGIAPIDQPAASLAALTAAAEECDAMELAALRLATGAAGSLILALALLEQRIDPDAAFAAAELDESYQIENWGEDPEQTKRRAGLKSDLVLADRFATLHRD